MAEAKTGIPEGQMKYCEGCGAKMHKEALACPKCGYSHKAKVNSPRDMAIVGLFVNLLFLPGLGTIIGGDKKTGITQLVLFIIGIPLCLIIVGLFVLFGVWIWAVVTSVNQISSSS